MNSTLTWHDSVKIICNKISKNVGVILKIKKKCKHPNSEIVVSLT